MTGGTYLWTRLRARYKPGIGRDLQSASLFKVFRFGFVIIPAGDEV